ncbi:MAG: molybdenum cofactor guanylyltransferase MobA [Pseudomonadota bacterium]
MTVSPGTGPVLGLVLAGGRATRMGGGDKGLRPLGKRPLMGHVIRRLAPQVDTLAINAGGDPGRFADFALPVLPDSVPGHAGPLAGVLAGLDWAAEAGAPWIVTAAADTPFLPKRLVVALRAAAYARDTQFAVAAVPDTSFPSGYAPQPTFGLWPVACREELRATLVAGKGKIMAFTKPRGLAEVVFEGAPFDPFFNVNTLADLAEAEAMLQAGAACG